MSRKRKNRPSTPRKVVVTEAEIATKAEAEAQAEEDRRQERTENRRVRAMPGGRVVHDARTGKITTRRVDDVVDIMARTKDDAGQPLIGPEETGAVRRLSSLIEQAHGDGGSCLSSLERVSGRAYGDPTLASVIRHTDAAKAIVARLKKLGPINGPMLRELCDGSLSLTCWHGVVERHTGEAGSKAQGGIVRLAFRELARVERVLARESAANDKDPPPDIAMAG